jgi:hypothetical protein
MDPSLRTEHTARADQALHAVDELGERAVVFGTVVPRATRPDRLARHVQRFPRKEILFDHLHTVTEFLQLEPVDQSHGVHVAVTREAYLTSVHGERVAFDGHNAIPSRGQGQDELAVARTDDRDGGVTSNAFP